MRARIERRRAPVTLFACVLLAACTSSESEREIQLDTTQDMRADTLVPLEPPALQDTYVEGSQRVWEAARDRGVIFRAVGQEPGWVVEIEGGNRITFVTNYGADEVVTPVPEPVVDTVSRTTAWHAVTDTTDLRIDIREESCSDSMSGERFSYTATVVLNGTTYQGCGRMLDRLP